MSIPASISLHLHFLQSHQWNHMSLLLFPLFPFPSRFTFQDSALNPIVHKYLTLPPLKLPPRRFATIGFGYDHDHHDFKVVVIWDILPSKPSYITFQIYSTRTSCWTPPLSASPDLNSLCFENTYPSISSHLLAEKCCFINGCIHWIIYSSYDIRHLVRRLSMLTFDCKFEEWTTMEFPQSLSSTHKTHCKADLLNYAGMVSLLVEVRRDYLTIELWVMEEHGVSESWKKIYMIRPTLSLDGPCFTVYDHSYENVDPSKRLTNPSKYHKENIIGLFYQLSSDYVYEETMLLTDHPQARSYKDEEMVSI